MKIIHISPPVLFNSLDESVQEEEEIHVITQFFIPLNKQRVMEIQSCLQRNVLNSAITRIHLLNERIYEQTELGLGNTQYSPYLSKIHQHNLGQRIQYKDIFQYVNDSSLHGYIVFTNSDIFFDDTICNLYKTDCFKTSKSILMQLRYEYRANHGTNLDQCPIFGPRMDSQDTWIIHSKYNPKPNQWKAFGFALGVPGCDNKLVYLFSILGYQTYNHPAFVKTFHYHTAVERNYTIKDQVPKPWGVICPVGTDPYSLPLSLGINMQLVAQHKQNLWFDSDNLKLKNFIENSLKSEKPFLILRIAGIENNTAVFGNFIDSNPLLIPRIQALMPVMKNNAGIKMSNLESVKKYSKMYLKAFENCQIYCGWDVQGNYIGHISESHEWIKQTFSSPKHEMCWALTLDIFHYIHSNPWTHALRGKRILLISQFEETLNQQIPIRDKLFDGVDLFPECSFKIIKPPMTQCDEPSLEFDQELDLFYKRLDLLKDQYDVALVSAGGYGNIICNYIYENHGKSAMYIGGVLQVLWGIVGNRWLKERSDILRLYMNSNWKRPKVSERPLGCNKVEGGCYW